MEKFTKISRREDKITLCSDFGDANSRIPNLGDNVKVKKQEFVANGNDKTMKDISDVFKNTRTANSDYESYKSNFVNIQNSYLRREYARCLNYCLLSVCLAFLLGLIIGVFLVNTVTNHVTLPVSNKINNSTEVKITLNSVKLAKGKTEKSNFHMVSFTGDNFVVSKDNHKPYENRDVYPKGMSEDMKDILKDNKNGREHQVEKTLLDSKKNFRPGKKTVIYDNIFWGPLVENHLPEGYGHDSSDIWEQYVNGSEIVKMEIGCGRMQNRLVTFEDGIQACVRYRQNTDQIQGEIFSFYVGRLLNLTNLAPSVIKVVDLNDKLWKNVANDIGTAQWNSNRAVVLTQYVPSLESATIPEIFKPSNRHLNKFDVLRMSLKENDTVPKNFMDKLKSPKSDFDNIDVNLNQKTIDSFVELAQWSDLIIFDFLTANLDRIVNNLFNFQWNINIMDGPAHNLARKMDSGLLMFLDNESGLLHGYRLLKKYNVYHNLMLDNLCVYRKTTVDSLKSLYDAQVGLKLSDVYHKKNNAIIRDVLPPLPEKNVKILHERIGKVLNQIEKCGIDFSNR